jgi:hypothetical protein
VIANRLYLTSSENKLPYKYFPLSVLPGLPILEQFLSLSGFDFTVPDKLQHLPYGNIPFRIVDTSLVFAQRFESTGFHDSSK